MSRRVLRRCQQLMYVFPVLRWLKVFSQTWEGDVTMVLPSSYMQLKKSITNPTHADLLQACKQVRKASVWGAGVLGALSSVEQW